MMTEQQDDPMPVFVLKAKDNLTPEIVLDYGSRCSELGWHDQANEVIKAYNEIVAWRSRNPDLCKNPDHEHVPVT